MRAEILTRDDPLDGLNPAQREAVMHVGGPLLVVAGPGTGKTRVLTHRVAYRVREGGTGAESIMAITFTNRAAGELRERVCRQLGTEAHIRVGTFHWMCSGLLRRYGTRVGYQPDFPLLGPAETRDILRSVIEKGKTGLPVRVAAAGISAIKNGADASSEARRLAIPEESLRAVAAQYKAALQRLGAMDLDDLLYQSARLLVEYEVVRNVCRRSLSLLLVDEYQDTNSVQQELLRLLAPVNGEVTAVGDEDQSIYAWRQASTGSNARFLEQFPDARVITLDQTYRSTKLILRPATEMISHNRERSEKSLHTTNPAGDRPVCYVAQDENDEASWIAEQMHRLKDSSERSWADFAVLYRINAQSRALEDALVRGNIPYRVLAGQRFYDRPEIRTVAAYLRLALEPTDDAAASFLLGQVSGIGTKRLEGVRAQLAKRDRPLADAFRFAEELTDTPTRSIEEMKSIGLRMQHVGELRHGALTEIVDAAISAASDSFRGGTQESEEEDLAELREVLAAMSRTRMTLRELTDRLSLDPERSKVGQNAVSLLSLHSAKGLEFPIVFITGLEEGLIPHRHSFEADGQVEEERRLCYVGMTRAQTLLYFSYARMRLLAGHAFGGVPSRFLQEMGAANVLVRFSDAARLRPRLHTVARGERVHHTRWLDGTVVGVEGTGRDVLVTIAFDTGGRRRIQLCHAPLSRLSSTDGDGHASA